MSVQYKTIQTLVTGLESITCSRCKKVITPDDFVEWQELQSIDFIGGYGSKFGDGIKIRIDLCQQCLYDLCKDFVEYDESQFNSED